MTTIDLTVEKSRRANAIKRAKERNIVIPTYAQMKDPSRIPASVREELKESDCGISIPVTSSGSTGTTNQPHQAGPMAESTTLSSRPR